MLSDDDCIEVWMAANPLDAHLLRIQLETEGMRAEVVGECLANAVGELPFGAATAPRIVVARSDAGRARTFLMALESGVDLPGDSAPAWACPRCGTAMMSDAERCPSCQSRIDEANEPVGSGQYEVRNDEFSPLVVDRRALFASVIVIGLLCAAVAWLKFEDWFPVAVEQTPHGFQETSAPELYNRPHRSWMRRY